MNKKEKLLIKIYDYLLDERDLIIGLSNTDFQTQITFPNTKQYIGDKINFIIKIRDLFYHNDMLNDLEMRVKEMNPKFPTHLQFV